MKGSFSFVAGTPGRLRVSSRTRGLEGLELKGDVPVSRVDARDKATGNARYVADLTLPGMLHAAVVRSNLPHARILQIDASEAKVLEGVVGVYTAEDVCIATYGRAVRDVPIMANGMVRYVGERVAAVVATSRELAEAAAARVDVTYEPLEAALSAEEALSADAPLVHDAPWEYPGAAVKPSDGHNLQSKVIEGNLPDVEAALAQSAYMVDETYLTPAVHQGYLEPQACIADVDRAGHVRLWLTTKAPYRARSQIAACLGIPADDIDVQPAIIGGDFGGKGSPGDAPLCIELSRLTGQPVKLVLRYSEDLSATDVRHPARMRVRLGCDADGKLQALAFDALLDGGAYAGYKPASDANLHGILHCATAYCISRIYIESRIAYTNTLPKGHMRSPGAPQAAFALESAIDELAEQVKLDPVELRRRNVWNAVEDGGAKLPWAEARGQQTLEAALGAARPCPSPEGWLTGRGIALYAREVPAPATTSLRLADGEGGRLHVEVPIPETGTGSHTVVRELLASELEIPAQLIDVQQVSTEQLLGDPGVGGSRVTVGLVNAVVKAADAWRCRKGDQPVVVAVEPDASVSLISYCAQVAQVAVDPATGQLKVLELISAVDVGDVVNPLAHQMQIDGGAVMGYGFACLEDLAVSDGQVWAGSLGDYKLPSSKDVPVLTTVLVRGGKGVGRANIKPIGEVSNVPTAAAVANAVAEATGLRIRRLPLTAERIKLSPLSIR